VSNTFYFILTKVGIAKLVNAQMTQSKVEYSHVAFGDGNGGYYEPSAEATALKNEVYRSVVSIVEQVNDGNNQPTNRVKIESVIPATVGNFTIREIGLIDSAGDLVGIGKYPTTYKPSTEQGAAKDLIVRIIVETTNVYSITLKVDPSIAIASRQYVDEKIASINQNIEDIGKLNDLEIENVKNVVQAINKVNKDVTGVKESLSNHLLSQMPHRFFDNGKWYRWGFRTENGDPQVICEEVTE